MLNLQVHYLVGMSNGEDTTMSHTITAAEVDEGMELYHSVHANAITVTKVSHNVRYYTRRVTFVYGTDVHGVLVELICHPEFAFIRAESIGD